MRRHHALVTIAIAAAAVAGPPVSSYAQESGRPPVASIGAARDPGRPGAFEVFIGGDWLLSESLGSSTATMLRNDTGSTPYNYFSTSGTRDAAPAFRAGIGYAITRIFTVEGGFLVSRGNVTANISNDVEQVAATTSTSRLTQYFIDASVLAHLDHLAFSGGAGVPFFEGGIGYLRQMLEANLAVETGQIYHFGGGIRYLWARSGGRMSAIGFRAGARLYVSSKGLSFGSGSHTFPAVSGGLVVMF
jgi:hypothetical protein